MGAACCTNCEAVPVKIRPPGGAINHLQNGEAKPLPYCAIRYANILESGGCVLFNGAVVSVQFSGLNAIIGGASHLRVDSGQMVQDTMQSAIEVIHSHGGDVIRITGQCLLALWDQSVFEALAPGSPVGSNNINEQGDPARYEALYAAVQCMLALPSYMVSIPFVKLASAVSFGNLALSVQTSPMYGSTLLMTGRPIALLAEAEAFLAASSNHLSGTLVTGDAWMVLASHCRGTRIRSHQMWWVYEMDPTLVSSNAAFLSPDPYVTIDGKDPLLCVEKLAHREQQQPGRIEKALVVTMVLPKALLAEDENIPQFLEGIVKDIVADDGELIQVCQKQRSSILATMLFVTSPALRAPMLVQRCIDLSRRLWDMPMHFAIAAGPVFWGTITAGGQAIKLFGGPAALTSISLVSSVDISGHLLWCNATAVAECDGKFEMECIGLRKLEGEFQVSLFVCDHRQKHNHMKFSQLQVQLAWHSIKVAGRDKERAMLDGVVHSMLQKTLQTPVVCCVGLPGMGKSSMAYYLQYHWALLPVCVVDCADSQRMQRFSTCQHLFCELFSLVRYTCKESEAIGSYTTEELICWLLGQSAQECDILEPLDVVLGTHFGRNEVSPNSFASSSLYDDTISASPDVRVAAALLGSLLRVIHVKLRVLVVCFDNSHNMDTGSWQVLQEHLNWARAEGNQFLLLLCVDPLQETACSIGESQAALTLTIPLSNMADDDMVSALAGAFHDRMLPNDMVAPELAKVVMDVTWGHPVLFYELVGVMRKKRMAISVDGSGKLSATYDSMLSLGSVDFTALKSVRILVNRMFAELPEIMQTILQTAAAAITEERRLIYPQMVLAMFPQDMHDEVRSNLTLLVQKGLLLVCQDPHGPLVLSWEGPTYQFSMKAMPELLRQALPGARYMMVNQRMAHLLAKLKDQIRHDAANYRLWTTYCYRAGHSKLARIALQMEAQEHLANNNLDRHAAVQQELAQMVNGVFSVDDFTSVPPTPCGMGIWTPHMPLDPSPGRRLMPITPQRMPSEKRALLRSDVLEVDCLHSQFLTYCNKLKLRKTCQEIPFISVDLQRYIQLLRQAYQLPSLHLNSRGVMEDALCQMQQLSTAVSPTSVSSLLDLLHQLMRLFAHFTQVKLTPQQLYQDVMRWTPEALIPSKYDAIAAAQLDFFHLWRQLAAARCRSPSSEFLEQSTTSTVLQRVMDTLLHLFAEEESLMALTGYPNLEEHEEAHQRFLDKILDIYAQFSAGMHQTDSEVLQFLHQYMTTHVPFSDQLFADWMVARFGDSPISSTRLIEMLLHGEADTVISGCSLSCTLQQTSSPPAVAESHKPGHHPCEGSDS